MATRSQTKLFLVESTISELRGSRLPSRRQVLQLFLHLHLEQKQSTNDAAMRVIHEVMEFWERARIPVQLAYRARDKLVRLFKEWTSIKKNSKLRRPTQLAKEAAFVASLPRLFDIAHQDAMKMIKNEEDRAFLQAQREDLPRGIMGPRDMSLAAQESRTQQRKESVRRQREAANTSRHKPERSVELASSTSSSKESIPTAIVQDSDAEVVPSSSKVPPSKRQRRASKPIVDQQLASAMDRTKLSDREGVFVLSAAARSLGHAPQELIINRESFRRSRQKFRAMAAAEIKAAFKPEVPLTVHWDGKIVPASDNTGRMVERLPVLVSGDGVEKLLAVPKLASSTAQACADAVLTTIEDWELSDRIHSLGFDTTAVNTGLARGTCTIIEQRLNRDVLHLACRHHIMELVLENAFTTCLGPSSGPEVQIFKRLQSKWDLIDTTTPEPFATDDMPQELFDKRDDLLIVFVSLLESPHPRDDYRELLELGVIILGGVPKRGMSFRRPGGLHRARWMAKGIYAMKAYLFRSQFQMSAAETNGIRRLATFVVQIYIDAWFKAPIAAAAPAHDLALYKTLVAYHDKALGKATVPVLGRHLWYLSERLVPLAFYDPGVPLSIKREMVAAIREEEGADDPPRRITLDSAVVAEKTLVDFVTTSSASFFEILGLDSAFLVRDPSEWAIDPGYNDGASRVDTLHVTNDFAERGVALMQDFNLSLTKDEDQRQFLLQVVEAHRKAFPTTRKSVTCN